MFAVFIVLLLRLGLNLYLLLCHTDFTKGGPSGSGKTSLAHKMANIVGCEVVSLESYFKPEQVKDFKHDDFSSLDQPLLSKVTLSLGCKSIM